MAVKLPKGVTLEDLVRNYDTMKSEYASAYRRIKVLDLVDRGEIWELISRKFPEYQITPDTNYVNYIKENILASVYTVGKSASLIARSKQDKEVVDKLNKVLDTLWGVLKVRTYQLKAGERAALCNLGITQVGWSKDIQGGTNEHWYKGDVVLKNIDPLNYGRDPFADTLEDAAFVIYHDKYHKMTLMENPNYRKVLKDMDPEDTGDIENYNRTGGTSPGTNSNYYTLVIHWIKAYDETKEEVVIHEIHTIANKTVLYVKEDIKPRMFPFAELYSNIPVKDPVGISEPSKILSSTVVTNLLDGIVTTHAYKAQRPPRLISDRSGLNLRTFTKYGNDPDKSFIVNGNPDEAVRYVSFPPLPQSLENTTSRLSAAIERMSGIDSKYTGKDTGSILTTGGIDSMLAQATMRDTTRISLYEEYTQELTRLIISHMIYYGDKREYGYTNPTNRQMEFMTLDFPKIPDDILFNYSINISSELPKTKARIQAQADAMLEKSMQYQANPEILTIEEWLSFQDFPGIERIVERLELDRQANMTEQVTQVLAMFSGLVEQGMDPNEAVNVVTQQMQSQQTTGGPPAAPPNPVMK